MEEIPTIQNENDKKLGFNIEFEIKSDKNNIYSLILNADTYFYLNIKATQKNDNLFNKTYSNQFSVDKIKENKYFNMFDDLKEICNEISERINKKEMKLVENKNSLNFYILLPITKIKEINFELKEEEMNDKDKINNLNKLIMKLKDEINEIKNNHSKEISKNKKEINELKSIINTQNKEINEIKEEFKNIINYIETQHSILQLKNSLIINNNIEYNKLIKSWINPKIEIGCELLYRLSRDGDQISKFHELSDNKGPTLTLIETTDGNKFGIYTPLSWDNSSGWKGDYETFLFNLNKNEKYKKKTKDYSIYCSKDYGPWIANFGFKNVCQMRKILLEGDGINSYYENGAKCLPNNSGGNKYFEVNEVEVYKIKL